MVDEVLLSTFSKLLTPVFQQLILARGQVIEFGEVHSRWKADIDAVAVMLSPSEHNLGISFDRCVELFQCLWRLNNRMPGFQCFHLAAWRPCLLVTGSPLDRVLSSIKQHREWQPIMQDKYLPDLSCAVLLQKPHFVAPPAAAASASSASSASSLSFMAPGLVSGASLSSSASSSQTSLMQTSRLPAASSTVLRLLSLPRLNSLLILFLLLTILQWDHLAPLHLQCQPLHLQFPETFTSLCHSSHRDGSLLPDLYETQTTTSRCYSKS